MISATITITSKNQVTLPAQLVREMHLTKRRRLTVYRKGDEIILKPEPDLMEQMQEIWASLPPFRGTSSDDELQTAIRDVWKHKNI